MEINNGSWEGVGREVSGFEYVVVCVKSRLYSSIWWVGQLMGLE